MQQRQPRLGDILDDYCPRERRVTNHAIVAMVGADVKQTRCTTCDAEHEYKHARVPRQRRKAETPAALYSQVAANGPKRVAHEAPADAPPADEAAVPEAMASPIEPESTPELVDPVERDADETEPAVEVEEGPVHRPLIRATLPRPEGQPPPARPVPEFTIRQPGGRQNRFRHRHGRGAQQFQGNRSNGNLGGPMRSGRTPQGSMPPRLAHRHGGQGRKRSK